MAAAIPGARFVALEGQNHVILETDPGRARFLEEVGHFLEFDDGMAVADFGLGRNERPHPARARFVAGLRRDRFGQNGRTRVGTSARAMSTAARRQRAGTLKRRRAASTLARITQSSTWSLTSPMACMKA